MLIEVAGSLLNVAASQRVVRATGLELRLPVEVKLARLGDSLVFCADVPTWRWQTDWDRPFGELRMKIEETSLEKLQ